MYGLDLSSLSNEDLIGQLQKNGFDLSGLGGGNQQPMFNGANPFKWSSNTWSNLASGLQGIGNLFMANRAYGLAKDQFNYQKNVTDTNMANQMKSYNTTLAGMARSRGVMEGQTEAQVQAFIDENKLTRA